MTVTITRTDYTSDQLRCYSRYAETVVAARRMLALAGLLEGQPRWYAARQAGMDRQTLRDWVHRYNAEGISGLYDRKSSGRKPRLSDAQRQEIYALVLAGPDPERDGVTRWRCKDIRHIIAARYGVDYGERQVENLLKQMGAVKLSTRPQHPRSNAQDQETFKKTSRPS